MSLSREVPEKVEDRLIVALDVPSIGEARDLVGELDGLVSFFKVGLWLQFAAGFDGLIDELIKRGKKVFLDAKMFDIGETVKQGVARAVERGFSFVTVHGDGEIMKAAVEGRGDSRLKILAITVLTSVDQDGLRDLGYICSVEELIRLRVQRSIACGCDGIIAGQPRPHPATGGLAKSADRDTGRKAGGHPGRRSQAPRNSRAGDRGRGGLSRRRPPDRQKRRSRARGRANNRGYAPRRLAPLSRGQLFDGPEGKLSYDYLWWLRST
jgi:orotidine 5'-phosphate decarboxylase subfamily 1